MYNREICVSIIFVQIYTYMCIHICIYLHLCVNALLQNTILLCATSEPIRTKGEMKAKRKENPHSTHYATSFNIFTMFDICAGVAFGSAQCNESVLRNIADRIGDLRIAL